MKCPYVSKGWQPAHKGPVNAGLFLLCISKCMTTEKVSNKQKISSRGGARPGAGRPKGSTALITARTLLDAIENRSGQPFEELLADGYNRTIVENNNKLRVEYERMFLGKVLSDRVQMDINETPELVEQKQEAFKEALAKLAALNDKAK